MRARPPFLPCPAREIRVDPSSSFPLLRLLERMKFELPEKDLEALALEEELPHRRRHVVCLVHRLPVNEDREALSVVHDLHFGPLAERAFDVVLPAGVEQLLE